MKHSAVVVAAAAILGGCGGGGGGSSQAPPPPPVTNASPGGIWEGTLGSGEDILGLVTESGEFHFLNAADLTQYFGTVSVNANAASAQFTGYTAIGFEFQDGTTSGTGSLTGTVQARSTFTANSTFRTSAGNSNTNTINLTYNALYDRDSSLATIAGNFTDLRTGAIVNINSSGVAFSQNPANGCVLNGTVSIINAQFNAYRVQYSYSSCQGVDAILNGPTFRGLATLDNTASPEVLIVGAQALAGSVGVSAIEVLERAAVAPVDDSG
jgi:hypothetical protein